jgi:hypothetical protein
LQTVPTLQDELDSRPDPGKTRRAFAAIFKMKKLDIAKLRKTYDG